MSNSRRWLGAVLTATTLSIAQPACARCVATEAIEGDVGTWTGGQVSNRRVTTYTRSAGLDCSGALLTLASDNRITATVRSRNGFSLRRDGSEAEVSYLASAAPDGSFPYSQGGSINHTNRTLIGILGIGNSSDVRLPISLSSFKGNGLVSGTYVDVITIDWNWRVCEGLNLLVLCLFYDQGSARTTYTIRMQVDALPPVISLETKTVSDPIRGTSSPLAIPGSKQLTTIKVTNPDVVALDRDALVIEVPTPEGQSVSLVPVEGQTSPIELVQGGEDGMSLSYRNPSDTGDDVDFSSDGRDWSLIPSDPVRIRSTRLRLKGTLQPSKSVTVTLGRSLM